MKIKKHTWYLCRWKGRKFYAKTGGHIPKSSDFPELLICSIKDCKEISWRLVEKGYGDWAKDWKRFSFALSLNATDFKSWNLYVEDLVRPATKKEVRESILKGKFKV